MFGILGPLFSPALLSQLLFSVSLFGRIDHNRLWYAVPLVISFSLVYGATKHEEMGAILHQSYRAGTWIVGFIFVVFAIVWLLDWLLIS
jgi:hypothetical protein